jgi:uncharacterized membrane protein YhaH (DUF805 family)
MMNNMMNNMDIAAMEQFVQVIGLGLALATILVFSTIIVLNRRNMNGWDLPVRYVWFSFSGRINRKTYWLTGIIGTLLVQIIYEFLIGMVLLGVTYVAPMGETIISILALATLFPLLVFMIWASIAISLKRLHDRNRSGWFFLIFLIPIIGMFWLMIEIAFLRGTQGVNRFGPPQPDRHNPQATAGNTTRYDPASTRQSRSIALKSTSQDDETPSSNLNELPRREMIASRLGTTFLGPAEPENNAP